MAFMEFSKNKKILIIVHQETSTPGRIGMMLRAMGFALDIRRPCLGDALPETMDEHAGAVVFGGPMSANDPEPWIKSEIDWIGVPLKERKPFLGVCLGAQMLAKHLGGTVGGHAEERVEIGYYPIYPVNGGDGINDWPQQVYQWHRESFTLPREAKLFARGEHFENQAFRYGPAAYGIQFHPEVTREQIQSWLETDGFNEGVDVERIAARTDELIDEWNRIGTALCEGFLETAAAPVPSAR